MGYHAIKGILEDIADSCALEPAARVGARISDLRVKNRPLEATKRYKVAGWAPVGEGITGEPIWDAVSRHLRAVKTVPPLAASRPRFIGVKDNPGLE